jgi:hypothetical protein
MVDVANSLFVEKSKVQGSALSKWPGAVEASTSSAPHLASLAHGRFSGAYPKRETRD